MVWTKVGQLGFTLEGTGSQTETLPGTVQEDDVVIVAGCSDQAITNAGPIMLTSGYTVVFHNTTKANPGIFCYQKQLGASPETDVELDNDDVTGDPASTVLQVWRGADTTTHLDVASTEATGVSSMPDAPSITTITDGCLIIAIGLLDDDSVEGSVTLPSGYSNLLDWDAFTEGGDSTAMICSKEQASLGAENPAIFGGPGSDDWHGITMALRPAAAGGAANPKGPLGHPLHGPFGGPVG